MTYLPLDHDTNEAIKAATRNTGLKAMDAVRVGCLLINAIPEAMVTVLRLEHERVERARAETQSIEEKTSDLYVVGRILKQVREEWLGMTQVEFSEEVGLSKGMISINETSAGFYPSAIRTLEKVLELLKEAEEKKNENEGIPGSD